MYSELEQQYFRVLKALESVKYVNKDTPVFGKALEWIRGFPTALDNSLRVRLVSATCQAFQMTEAELLSQLSGELARSNGAVVAPSISNEEKLRATLPKGGWFEWYDKWTRESEPPLAYHIFASLCVLGSACGRRVVRRMGHFSIYTNYSVLLIGPTGRVKKTTAGQIAASLVKQAILCPILADKVTPERMISVLKQSGHHFIFAPEMAVFFGKQRYNEGLITSILRILDSPDEFIVETQTREQEVLQNLAVSFLGCTTPSLLETSMPDEVTSSGFMNRFVLVVEQDTERCFPTPGEPDPFMERKLVKTLERIKTMRGEMKLDEQATNWYNDWYIRRREEVRRATDDTLVEVMERMPIHLLKTAMLVHLVQCDNFMVCEKCLRDSFNILSYTERQAPKTIQSLKQSVGATELDHVVTMLIRLGGAADHSTLLRRLAPRMNTAQMKTHIKTLEESGRVRVGRMGSGTYYTLIGGSDVS